MWIIDPYSYKLPGNLNANRTSCAKRNQKKTERPDRVGTVTNGCRDKLAPHKPTTKSPLHWLCPHPLWWAEGPSSSNPQTRPRRLVWHQVGRKYPTKAPKLYLFHPISPKNQTPHLGCFGGSSLVKAETRIAADSPESNCAQAEKPVKSSKYFKGVPVSGMAVRFCGSRNELKNKPVKRVIWKCFPVMWNLSCGTMSTVKMFSTSIGWPTMATM